MKPVAFLLFSFIAISARAQSKSSSVTRSIHDDDKTLSIKVHAIVDEKKIDYENTFNVEGWSKAQKDALIRRITDSLGISQRKVIKL